MDSWNNLNSQNTQASHPIIWATEASIIAQEISKGVVHVSLSHKLNSSTEKAAFLNIETLERKRVTVRLNSSGFCLVGSDFDDVSLDRSNNFSSTFETSDALMQSLSPLYRSKFASNLSEKLSQLAQRTNNEIIDTTDTLLNTTVGTSSYGTSVHVLENKILHAKKRIQEEQHRRDANVEEYLKMAATAQRAQLPQVKTLFEKRNTKAATHIAALQRKLERYQRDLQVLIESSKLASEQSPNKLSKAGSPNKSKGIEANHGSEASESSNTSSHRISKSRMHNMSHGIKSVGGNLKEGLTGISGTVISKPREIASYIMRQKFGSADNIPSRVKESVGENAHHGSENITPGENLEVSQISTRAGKESKEEDGVASEYSVSARSSSVEHEIRQNSGKVHPDLATLTQQLRDMQEEMLSFREDYENFKAQTVSDSAFICQALQEERFRSERLEEQVNDLTELHQAETGNLKQGLADTEEKLCYQSEERLRDLAELLDSCQAKISRLEQQQQQLVTIEGIENSTARALAVKLVNIGLTFLQLILLLVATFLSTINPFVGSRIRIFVSVVAFMILFLVHRKWPLFHVEVLEFCSDMLNRL